MSAHFVFAPFDNPMHLSKVGNWVITFISPQNATHVELAITNVIPRQNQAVLQPRRLVMTQSTQEHAWKILSLECYDPLGQTDRCVDLNATEASVVYQQVIAEFEKYDVDIQLIQSV